MRKMSVEVSGKEQNGDRSPFLCTGYRRRCGRAETDSTV